MDENKPFMGRKLSLFYVGTIVLAQPYFNNINPTVYEKIRPWEALFRYAVVLFLSPFLFEQH
jgi:hypothetical protein